MVFISIRYNNGLHSNRFYYVYKMKQSNSELIISLVYSIIQISLLLLLRTVKMKRLENKQKTFQAKYIAQVNIL